MVRNSLSPKLGMTNALGFLHQRWKESLHERFYSYHKRISKPTRLRELGFEVKTAHGYVYAKRIP